MSSGLVWFFFFKQKTAYEIYQCDWSSDVCSSDLDLRSEWVVNISGIVKQRPEKLVNKNILTGAVEIDAKKLVILNTSKTPPFEIGDSDGYDINEEIRMKYRYLDMRRERIAKNMVNRSKMTTNVRNFLASKDFIEVETPILSKSRSEEHTSELQSH